MAQKVVVSLVDDLDETEADETVEFGIDGATYEIDLSDSNAAKLRTSSRTTSRTPGGSPVVGVPSRARPPRQRPRRSPERRSRVGRPRAEPGHPGMGAQAGDDGLGARPYPSEVSEAYHKAHS